MMNNVEQTIATCKHCGKKVRVNASLAKWSCPQCEGLNENTDYIPEALPVDQSVSESANSHQTRYSFQETQPAHDGSSAHGVAGVGFALAIVAFLLLFLYNIPILFIVLGIISLILCIADARATGKSCVIGTIGGILAVVIIVIAIIAWINNWFVLQSLYDTTDTFNNLGKYY